MCVCVCVCVCVHIYAGASKKILEKFLIFLSFNSKKLTFSYILHSLHTNWNISRVFLFWLFDLQLSKMNHSVWSDLWCFSQAVWTRWSTTRSAVTSGRWRLRCRGAAWRWSVRPWAPSYTCWPGFRGSAVWGTSWSITQRQTNGWFPVKSARFPSPAASSVWWTHAALTKRTWIQHLHPRREESSVAIWACRWYKTTGSVGAENRQRHPLRYVHQITVSCRSDWTGQIRLLLSLCPPLCMFILILEF